MQGILVGVFILLFASSRAYKDSMTTNGRLWFWRSINNPEERRYVPRSLD
jgi:hypothetical protein